MSTYSLVVVQLFEDWPLYEIFAGDLSNLNGHLVNSVHTDEAGLTDTLVDLLFDPETGELEKCFKPEIPFDRILSILEAGHSVIQVNVGSIP